MAVAARHEWAAIKRNIYVAASPCNCVDPDSVSVLTAWGQHWLWQRS